MIAQEQEQGWWGDSLQTFGEEAKQMVYAKHMGLDVVQCEGRWPIYRVPLPTSPAVVDFGGGPTSMLLKSSGLGIACVVEPMTMPGWVRERYREADVALFKMKGERFTLDPISASVDLYDTAQYNASKLKRFDEGWLYNVLQHTEDPELVCRRLREAADYLRVFEWVGGGTNAMHPHELDSADLSRWLGLRGRTFDVDEGGAVGTVWAAHGAWS